MAMRYTKKQVEEAALICAVAASTPDLTECYDTTNKLLFDTDILGSGYRLAFAAWDYVIDHAYGYEWATRSCVDAEAEALLRTGWLP